MKCKNGSLKITLISIIILILIGSSITVVGCAQTKPSVPQATPTSPGSTQPTTTTVIKFSSWAPPTHPGTITAKQAYAPVEKMTGGRIKVEVYDSESLAPMAETFDALDRGIIDLSFYPIPYLTNQIPWVGVSLVPGLMKDYIGVYESAYNGLRDMLQESLNKLGLKIKVLSTPFTAGPTYLIIKGKRVTSPKDLKGMKLGCPTKNEIKIAELLGASGVPMRGVEAYEALSRGVVDAQFSNIPGFYAHKMHEPADYILLVGFGCNMVADFGSSTNLAKLSEPDREAISYAAVQRGLLEAFMVASSESRYMRAMLPHLKEVIQPTKEQLDEFYKLLDPFLQDFIKQSGAEGQKALEIARKYNP